MDKLTAKTVAVIIRISLSVNSGLNIVNSIRVFFISSIGPKIRKAAREAVLKCSRKGAAINASAWEHTEIRKANSIIPPIEYTES